MLEQVLHDVLCRGTAAEQRVCLASTVARDRLVDFVLQAIDCVAYELVGEARVMTLAAAFGVFLNAVRVDD